VTIIALVEVIAAIAVVFVLGYQDSLVAWAIAAGVALSSSLLVARVLK
jgi:hypothetical protein